MAPKYPDVHVEIDPSAIAIDVRDAVYSQLKADLPGSEAKTFLKESRRTATDRLSMVRLAQEWVTVVNPSGATFDPALPTDGDLAELSAPIGGAQRWQYAVAGIGSLNTPGRMAQVLTVAGSAGWELVGVYDKASNWFAGMEKGFMLLKRPVPAGTTPEKWCITLRH